MVATAPASPTAPTLTAPAAPVWQFGDRWVMEWTSGENSGTKTISVLESHKVGDVSYYVVRVDDVEHYYTPELHWAFGVRESRVEARMIPPKPWFTWPLEPGRRWEHRGTFEDQRGKTAHLDVFRVVGVETVDVPAGRFQALRVTREGQRGESDEYWYAPDVRWYVRWVGRRSDASFEERLRSYDPVARRR